MNEDPFNDSGTQTQEKKSDFFEAGSPSCRFTNVGDMHQGQILDFEEAQQRDIKTGEPAFWPDGKPKMMLVVTLQTNERDAEIDDDDGKRKLYINKPGGMFAAIMTAKAKSKFLVGGTLAVKYTGNGKPTTPGFNPPKEYIAKYTLPGGSTPNAGADPVADAKAVAIEVFGVFKKTLRDGTTPQQAKEMMLAVAVDFFGDGTTLASLTAAQWRQMAEAHFHPQLPASGEVDESDIPF